MANLKQRLRRKNSSGSYDIIYLQADLSNVTGTLAVANGGTGATTAANARSNLQVPEIGIYTDDMDNLKTPGIYRVNTNTNLPGELYYGQVLSMYGGAGDTYAQLGISYSGDHLMFRGAADSFGWSNWYNVTGEIDSLKSSVSNGKSAVASAITDKGVSTSATAAFSTMASNIRAIATGIECFIVITTTNGNGSTVKAVKGSTTLTGTVSNEKCTLKVPSKGNWTVTVTSPTYGTSQTKTITVGDGNVAFTMCPQWVLNLKSAAVGSTTTIDGMVWKLVNKTSSAAVLGLNTIYSKTNFGRNTTYKGSTLASVASNFESQQLSSLTKSFLNSVTVSGVTAKVFVPTYAQMNGGFSHYNSNANRICQYQGYNSSYWTSSPYDSEYMWCVYYDDGHFYGTLPNGGAEGFRPHIEVNLIL